MSGPTWIVRQGSDLGATVSGVRQARGLTQVQLAELVSMDRSYLAKLEAGASVQLLDRALLLLRHLGADVHVTLTDTASPPDAAPPSTSPASETGSPHAQT